MNLYSYKTRHFQIEELVPPEVYESYGERAWWFLDPSSLYVLDQLRDKFGPITVNSWKWGGDRRYSGFRPPGCDVGAEYSQHRFGRAFDCIFKNHTSEEVRKEVIDTIKNIESSDDMSIYTDRQRQFARIGAIELGISWFHFDLRNTKKLLTFHP